MAGIIVSVSFDDVAPILDRLSALPDQIGNTFLRAALNKAIQPAFAALGNVTPVGPTRNLYRARNKKVVIYAKDRVGVGLVGYNQSGKAESRSAQGGKVRAGRDRAYHQWWIENGTKARQITKLANTPYQRRSKNGLVHWVSGQNGYIASSFNGLGEFRIRQRGGSFTTRPAYPKAFFMKRSQPFEIRKTPAGGVANQPPVRTAWERSQSQVASVLRQELELSLGKALEAISTFSGRTVSG
jgi:hypothetical protein